MAAPGVCLGQKISSKALRHKAEEFLASRKYANNLVDIIGQWDESNTSCILTLEMIFIHLLERETMYQEQTLSMALSEPSPEIRYIWWLRNCYEEVWEKLLRSLESSRAAVQLQALSTALKLMAAQGQRPLEPAENLGYYFPLHRLRPILMKLLSPDRDNTNLIARFQEMAEYKDALYFTWKSLPALTPKKQPNDTYINNLLELIDKMPLPKDADGEKGEETKLLCRPAQEEGTAHLKPVFLSQESPASLRSVKNLIQLHIPWLKGNGYFCWDQSGAKRSLNKVWACVMHWELGAQVHKKLLVVLLERVIQYLDKPILLTDFLMDSLDIDGPIGMLALQGVFLLVTKHNLDYPNIFTKLYSMFEPEIFHTKYKARLFYLSDLFLSSTHLPEALVAAFAKRLARLTLVAPPEDILIILLFVGNLLLRHPGLKRMIDHPEGGEVKGSSGGDPFHMEERDPLLSNALMTSLWEIRALQWHTMPGVAAAARFIRDPLPSVEYDMAAALERTGGHIFERELKNKVKDIMLTFERPTSMALPKGERLLQYWQLTTIH